MLYQNENFVAKLKSPTFGMTFFFKLLEILFLDLNKFIAKIQLDVI